MHKAIAAAAKEAKQKGVAIKAKQTIKVKPMKGGMVGGKR